MAWDLARARSSRVRALVLQHIAVEHPGVFRDFMAADGISWDTIELDEGDTIPALDDYDILIAMGGPMDVWEEDAHPWLVAEKAAIRAWMAQDKPFLGFCLGHQLLADALGGTVAPAAASEVGIMDVDLPAAGRNDPLFAGLSEKLTCMQWHSAAVTELPSGAAVLASSPICPVQAFRVGRAAYGLQFHIEVTDVTASEWGCVPAYAASLEAVMGAGALRRLELDMAAALPELNGSARTLYDNFMEMIRPS